MLISELSCSSGFDKYQQLFPNTVWPRLGSVLTSVQMGQSNFFSLESFTLVRTSEFTRFCSNVSGLHETWESDEDAGWGIRADQVRRLVFLVGHPTQALQSHIEIWRLHKNALKAEACLFLWNETCSCCKMFWHKKKKKIDDRRQLKRKEATPTLKFSP